MVPNIQTPTRAGIAVNHVHSTPSPFVKATKTVTLVALTCLAIYALSLKYAALISAVCIGVYGVYVLAHSLFGENKILGPAVVNRVANRMEPLRRNPRLRSGVSRSQFSTPTNPSILLNRRNPRLRPQLPNHLQLRTPTKPMNPFNGANLNKSNVRQSKPNKPRGAGQSCQVIGKRPQNPNLVRGGKPCNKHTPPKKVSFVKGDIAGRFYPTHNAENKSSVDKPEGKTTGKKLEGKS